MADRFNILLVGHGRLGQLIAAAAPQAGATIAGTIDDTNAGDLADRDRWRDVDVAIDASAPDAFVANLPALCALGCSLVVGTTGWQAHAADVRRQIDAAGIGAVVTANFSVGATLMDALTERAAKLFAPQDLYGAFVHETHHAAKKDAPSGTALLLKARSSGAAFRARSTSPRRGSASCPASTRSASTGRPRPSPSPTPSAIAPRSRTAPSSPRAGCAGAAGGLRCATCWRFDRWQRERLSRACGTALVTPFTSDGALDEPAITRLARRQVEAGMHFLVPCGTTGESPTLDARERRRVVELVVEAAAGRVPVMAGAGGYDTREVIHAVAEMAAAGATGILSVSPYYNKPTPGRPLPALPRDRGEHVAADHGLQRRPAAPAATSSPRRCVRLAEIPNIIGVKEASGNIDADVRVCRARAAGVPRPVRRRCA